MAGNQWENHCHGVTGCALAGAAAFFAGIPRAVLIANGPSWCYFYAMRKIEHPHSRLGQRFFSTYPTNKSVIFGTESKLTKVLEQVQAMSTAPEVVLIENSCAISLIGDDIKGIANAVDLDCPVVAFDSGGIVGGHWEGYQKASLEYIQSIEFDDQIQPDPRTVNLIGANVSYAHEWEDIDEACRLLEKAGLHVHAIVGYGASVADMQQIHTAALNIVWHRECGLPMARVLEKELGMPYLDIPIPYGIAQSVEWVRRIVQALGHHESVVAPLEEECKEAESEIYERTRDLQKMWGIPWFETVVVSGPSSVAQGISNALPEWLDTAQVHVFAHDLSETEWSTPLQGHVEQLIHILRTETGLVCGSGFERKSANELHPRAWSSIGIANPDPMQVDLTGQPRVGIRGAKKVAEDVWRTYIAHMVQGS